MSFCTACFGVFDRDADAVFEARQRKRISRKSRFRRDRRDAVRQVLLRDENTAIRPRAAAALSEHGRARNVASTPADLNQPSGQVRNERIQRRLESGVTAPPQ
jgi:hypothetical protein